MRDVILGILVVLLGASVVTVVVAFVVEARGSSKIMHPQMAGQELVGNDVPGRYRITHKLDEEEALISLYDAASGKLLTPQIAGSDGSDAVIVYTDYPSPFRVVVLNRFGQAEMTVVYPPKEQADA